MELTIDFNNPSILRGHLEQALPQAGLGESKGRIFVGPKGGLSYSLFEDASELPQTAKIWNLSQVKAVESYWNTVKRYIERAGLHAEKYHLGLVSRIDKDDSRDVLQDGFPEDSYIYTVGIGSAAIGSVRKFNDFIEMIKTGKEVLDKNYQAIVEQGKPLKWV